MKKAKQMQLDYVTKHYAERRGVLIKKYRNLFGQYVFVIDENGIRSKVNVGKCIYADTPLGTKLTIGQIGRKLINIRPGFCKNTDEYPHFPGGQAYA